MSSLNKLVLYTIGIPAGLVASAIGFTYSFRWTKAPEESWATSKKLNESGIQYKMVKTNGIQLNVGEAGPKNGPVVLLLHGFPETGLLAWHEQIPALTKAGYKVVFPDLRGFNRSDKPEGVENYTMDVVSEDIKGLIDQYNTKVKVVAHDWGALTAWWVAHKYPQKVERMVILNTAHPIVFSNHLSTIGMQMLKSSYMLFFRLPVIPERKFEKNNFAFPLNILAENSLKKKAFASDSILKYIEAWKQPGTITPMFNYYRALGHASIKEKTANFKKNPKIDVNTLIIFGKQDQAIETSLAYQSAEQCKKSRVVVIDDGNHFTQHDAPSKVNEEILKFFKE